MIKRTVDISEAAYIKLKNNQLVIERQGIVVGVIPVEDLGVLMLQHPAIVITQAVLTACQQNNAIVICCNAKFLPCAVNLPIAEGHSLHSKILQQQVNIKATRKKLLWQKIVRQKIEQQIITLSYANQPTQALKFLAKHVKSNDKENHEAQAAKYYWKQLFGWQFKRDVNGDGINALLNYGYAIIRAMTARSIVSGGLHPTLGLYHKNQYNSLCLADDLMEPFRPWVDQIVYQLVQLKSKIEINRHSKTLLLNLFNNSVKWQQKTMPLMVAMNYFIAQLKVSYTCVDTPILDYPQRL